MFEKLPWGTMRERATKALRAWEEPQAGLPKLQEECGEVVAAVNQYRYGRISAAELASELADNLLMLVQASVIVGEDVLEEAIARKSSRLETRLAAHSRDCELCAGTGATRDLFGAEQNCSVCFPEQKHDVDCTVRLGPGRPCNCRSGLKKTIDRIFSGKRDYQVMSRIANDDFLEEVFRDFRDEMPVKEWRRRVYDRCVGHYLQQSNR